MNKRPSEVQVHHSGRGELTLAALIAEARTRAEKGLEEARKRHERADLYYNNVQPNENNTASDDDIVDPPRRHGLRNLLRTVISRMVEARQFPKVWPAKAEPRAIMAAEAANALLKHQRHRVGFDLWSVDVVRTAYLGGKVGVVPLWDETAGEPIWAPKLVKVGDVEVKELDEDGNEIQELLGYEGEVQWQMLLPHEYSYWPIPRDRDLRRCRSLMVRSFVDIHEAGALLGDEADQDFDRVPESDMVEAVEMWYVPCSRIPMGMHSLVVGGRVAIHEDWNLPFRRIPLAEFGIDPVAGTQYFT